MSVSPDTGDFTAIGVTVSELIGFAYDIQPSSLVGGPDWLYSAHYQVEARPPESFADRDSRSMVGGVRQLVQGLLVDHFGLEARRDDAPLYILEQADSGPRMQGSAAEATEAQALRDDGRGNLAARGVRLSALAAALEKYLSRPVLDRTGLTGSYDFDLHWEPDTASSGTLISALREQLGLNLRSVPVDVVVIDRVSDQPEEGTEGRIFEVVPPVL